MISHEYNLSAKDKLFMLLNKAQFSKNIRINISMNHDVWKREIEKCIDNNEYNSILKSHDDFIKELSSISNDDTGISDEVQSKYFKLYQHTYITALDNIGDLRGIIYNFISSILYYINNEDTKEDTKCKINYVKKQVVFFFTKLVPFKAHVFDIYNVIENDNFDVLLSLYKKIYSEYGFVVKELLIQENPVAIEHSYTRLLIEIVYMMYKIQASSLHKSDDELSMHYNTFDIFCHNMIDYIFDLNPDLDHKYDKSIIYNILHTYFNNGTSMEDYSKTISIESPFKDNDTVEKVFDVHDDINVADFNDMINNIELKNIGDKVNDKYILRSGNSYSVVGDNIFNTNDIDEIRLICRTKICSFDYSDIDNFFMIAQIEKPGGYHSASFDSRFLVLSIDKLKKEKNIKIAKVVKYDQKKDFPYKVKYAGKLDDGIYIFFEFYKTVYAMSLDIDIDKDGNVKRKIKKFKI